MGGARSGWGSQMYECVYMRTETDHHLSLHSDDNIRFRPFSLFPSRSSLCLSLPSLPFSFFLSPFPPLSLSRMVWLMASHCGPWCSTVCDVGTWRMPLLLSVRHSESCDPHVMSCDQHMRCSIFLCTGHVQSLLDICRSTFRVKTIGM